MGAVRFLSSFPVHFLGSFDTRIARRPFVGIGAPLTLPGGLRALRSYAIPLCFSATVLAEGPVASGLAAVASVLCGPFNSACRSFTIM